MRGPEADPRRRAAFHPLMQMSGLMCATRRARPASSAATTTALIGARRLLRDSSARWAADQHALLGEFVDDLASAPLPQSGVAGKRAAGAVRCGSRALTWIKASWTLLLSVAVV